MLDFSSTSMAKATCNLVSNPIHRLILCTLTYLMVVNSAVAQAPSDLLARVINDLPLEQRTCANVSSQYCLAGHTDEGDAVLHTVSRTDAKSVHEIWLVRLSRENQSHDVSTADDRILDGHDYSLELLEQIPVDPLWSVDIAIVGDQIEATLVPQ